MEGFATHVSINNGTEFHCTKTGNPAVSQPCSSSVMATEHADAGVMETEPLGTRDPESSSDLVMETKLPDIREPELSSGSVMAFEPLDTIDPESSSGSVMETELLDVRNPESSSGAVMSTNFSNIRGSESSVIATECLDFQPPTGDEQRAMNERNVGDDKMKSIEEYEVMKSSTVHNATEESNSAFVSREPVFTSFRDDDYFGTESSVFALYDSQSQSSSATSQIWDDSDDFEGNELAEDHSLMENNLSPVVHPVALKKCGEGANEDEALLPMSVGNEVATLLDTTSIGQLQRLWTKGESPSKKSSKSNSPHKKSKPNVVKTKKKSKKSCGKQEDIHEKRAAVAKSLKYIERQTKPNSSANEMNRNTLTKESNVSNGKLKIGNFKRKKTLTPGLELKMKFHCDLLDEAKCCTKPCTVRLQKLESMNLTNTKLHIDLTFPRNLVNKKVKAKSVKCKNIKRSSEAPVIALNENSPKKVWKKNAVKLVHGPETVTDVTFQNIDNSNKDAEQPTEIDLALYEGIGIENDNGWFGESNGTAPLNSKQPNTAGAKNSERCLLEDDVESIDFDSGDGYTNSDDDYKPSKKENLKIVFTRKKKPGRSPVRNKTSGVVTGNVCMTVKEEKEEVPKCNKNYNKKKCNGRIGRPPFLGHFECKLCDFTACEKNLVDKHKVLEHKQLTINCNFCDKKCRSRDSLLEHEAREHTNAKPFKCKHEGCDYASKVKIDLQRHQSKHATEKTNICQLCGWTTKWRRNLRIHHVMRHTEDRNFHCKLCSYTAKRNSDLKQHMYRHNEEKLLSCETCGFRVKTNYELRSHMLVHSTEKPFKCTFPGCQGATKTKADLTKHMRCHNTERSVVCPLCSKAFKDQYSLVKHHAYVHTDARQFHCEVCDKTFKCKAALKKHLNIHLGIKPFECEVCGKHFSTKSNLHAHAVTHDVKARPFVCPLCPYGAKEAHHLLAHIGTFHGDKYTYFCELCNKPFKRYGQLQIHYRRMHKKASQRLIGAEKVDVALLKMEMELDLEEASGKIRRKQKRNKKTGKTVSLEDDGNGEIKQEIMDTEDENEIQANGKELKEMENTSTNTLFGEMENIRNENCGDLISVPCDPLKQNKTGTETEYIDTEGSVTTDVDTEHYDTEIEKLETEMETAGTLECSEAEKVNTKEELSDTGATDSKSVLQGQSSATLAIYNGLRLPLATKGFMFNYQKNGKKPKSWFMDTSCMDETSAAKQNLYLRKIGASPPLPRGKKKKRKPGLTGFLKERTRKRNECLKKSNFIKGIGLVEKAGLSRTAKFKGKYTEFENLEGEDLDVFNVYEMAPNKHNSGKSTKQTSSGTKSVKSKKSVQSKTASQKKKKTKRLQSSQKKSKPKKILLSSEKKRKSVSKNIPIRKPSYIKRDSNTNEDGSGHEALENGSSESGVRSVQSKKKKEKNKGKNQIPTKEIKKESCMSPKSKKFSQIDSETDKQKYSKKYVPVKKVKRKGGKEIKPKGQKTEKPKTSRGCTKSVTAQTKAKRKKLKVKITSSSRKPDQLGLLCTDNLTVDAHLQGDVKETYSTESFNDAQNQLYVLTNETSSFSAEVDHDSQLQLGREVKLEEMETEDMEPGATSADVHPVSMTPCAGTESTESNAETAERFKEGMYMHTGGNTVMVMSSQEVNGDCMRGEDVYSPLDGDEAVKDNDEVFDNYFVVKREPTIEGEEG